MTQRSNPFVHSPRQLAALALLASLSGQVQAQVQTPATAAAAAAEPAQLDTVIVSGQGRSQQLQSVPIALQVIGAEQIRNLGASNLSDISRHIPGLELDANQATQPRMALRGIGSSDFGIGTDSPVGIYVDGVYTGKTGGALTNFNDVKRIEVLKGPQGTLFGRNSAGGAISIVSNEPSQQREGRALLRLGSDGLRHVEALVNQPLSESLSLRASAVSQHSDGFLSDAGSGQLAGGEDAWGLKLALRWQASEDSHALLSFEHEKLDQRARPAIGLVKEPAISGPLPYPADPKQFLDPRHAPLFNDVVGDAEARDFDAITLRIEHSLAWAEFISTTAYRKFNTRNRQDNDGTRNPAAFLSTTNLEGNTSWQQEFRLSGKQGSVDWLAGLSLYQERANQSALIDATSTSLDALTANAIGMPLFSTLGGLAQLAGVPGVDLLGQPWQEATHNQGRYRAAAIYGDAIWHLGAKTNLTTGLRLTRDQKRFGWHNPLRSATGLDAQLDGLDAAGLFPALVAAGALSQAEADGIQAASRNNMLVATSGATAAPLTITRSWTDLSPRLVLDHKLAGGPMVYASLTRGYQAGGFNTLQVNSVFEPEHVTNAELGLKGQLGGLGLSYSAALFHYRFENLQTMDLVPASTAGGLPAYQVTISDQQASGLDLDLQWQATRALRLAAAAELINQTYRRGRSSAGQDLSGLAVGTPRLSASVGATYQWAALGGQASSGLQYAYSSAQRCNPESYVQGQCFDAAGWRVGGPRQRWDLRVGWDSQGAAGIGGGSGWGLALIVNNVLNEQPIHKIWYEAAPLGSAYATLGRPRSIALELRASY